MRLKKPDIKGLTRLYTDSRNLLVNHIAPYLIHFQASISQLYLPYNSAHTENQYIRRRYKPTQRSKNSAIFFVQQFDTCIYNQTERISFLCTSVLFQTLALLVVFVSYHKFTQKKTPPNCIQLVFFLWKKSSNTIKFISFGIRLHSEFAILHHRLCPNKSTCKWFVHTIAECIPVTVFCWCNQIPNSYGIKPI